MKKKALSKVVFALTTILLFTFVISAYAVEQPIQFTDIDPESEIYRLVDAGIINGFGDGTFRPEGSLTRAQAAKIINLIFGYSEETLPAGESEIGFTDVTPEDWFSTHALVAQRAGYIQGYPDGTFREKKEITREEACVIMVRILELESSELVDYLQYTEQITDPISNWAKDDVALFLSLGFIEPDEEGRFYATKPMTRNDFCMLMLNFYEEEAIDDEGSETPGTPSTPSTPTLPGDTEEDEVVESIRNVQNVLGSLVLGDKYPAASQQIVDNINDTFVEVLKDAAAGTEITPEYIKKEYASEISAVRNLWEGLSEEDQARFRGMLLSKLKYADIDTLTTYFLGY
jgi:hypothetical protein